MKNDLRNGKRVLYDKKGNIIYDVILVDSEKNKISKIQKQDKYQQQLWSQSQISLFFFDIQILFKDLFMNYY